MAVVPGDETARGGVNRRGEGGEPVTGLGRPDRRSGEHRLGGGTRWGPRLCTVPSLPRSLGCEILTCCDAHSGLYCAASRSRVGWDFAYEIRAREQSAGVCALCVGLRFLDGFHPFNGRAGPQLQGQVTLGASGCSLSTRVDSCTLGGRVHALLGVFGRAFVV